MARALNLLRPEAEYRREQVDNGLVQIGLDLVGKIADPRPDDVLVVWNRIGRAQQEAVRFEAAGATVIVMENGYLGHGYSSHHKPVDPHGDGIYALALGRHNGRGRWPVGDEGRGAQHGLQTRPFRAGGEHILVFGQRGIGEPGIALPHAWGEKAVQNLRQLTDRPEPACVCDRNKSLKG